MEVFTLDIHKNAPEALLEDSYCFEDVEFKGE